MSSEAPASILGRALREDDVRCLELGVDAALLLDLAAGL